MYYKYIPDMYYKNIYTIDYRLLKNKDIKCIIFDLDNTLAPLNEKEPSKEVIELMKKIDRLGFKMVILSNALKKRVQPFKEKLNIDSSFLAWKPHKNKYKKILDLYELKPEQVACIGDQLVTDIRGANKMGMTSILTDSLTNKDHLFTYFNRFKELFIYRRFKKEKILIKGEYYE